MSREKECKCCHEWWYASVIKEDLCPNCYDYFKQLKQQLVEKDKEIKSLIVDYEKRISQEQELMSNMEHRLVEKDNLIEYGKEEIRKRNKRIDEIVERDKKLFAEKDKEIEEKMMSFEKRCQEYYKSDEFKRDFAIQELEKVNTILYESHYKKIGNKYYATLEDIENVIDQQINDLRGEKDE